MNDKNDISLDDICFLISENVEKQVYCSECPVPATEFFNAGTQSIRSEKMLLINSDEYGKQKIAKYDDYKYQIYRVYPRIDGYTELYLQSKAGIR